jgi:hypothetical protein
MGATEATRRGNAGQHRSGSATKVAPPAAEVKSASRAAPPKTADRLPDGRLRIYGTPDDCPNRRSLLHDACYRSANSTALCSLCRQWVRR